MLRSESGRVTVHLMFNTVRRDRRDRTYCLSEADYAVLMVAAGPVLEATASAAASASLQCVKCQTIFSHEQDGRGRRKELR